MGGRLKSQTAMHRIFLVVLFLASGSSGDSWGSVSDSDSDSDSVSDSEGKWGQHESLTNVSSFVPAYNNSDYKEQGEVVDLGSGLSIYTVGQGGPDTRTVVWNYDIMGFNGGRTRQLCDQLASQGFLVILPDYFRGQGQGSHALWCCRNLLGQLHDHEAV